MNMKIFLVCFSVHRPVLYGWTDGQGGGLITSLFHKDSCKKSLACDRYLKLPKIILTAFYIKNSIMIIAFVSFRHHTNNSGFIFTFF